MTRQTALDAPDKCVITERLAKTLFGDKNPIGEQLQMVGNRNVRMGDNDPYDSTLVYNVTAGAPPPRIRSTIYRRNN